MPIYAYRCSACGFENDYLQKITEPLLTDCPECGKSTLVKQVTAAGFQLKGSGWYVTDFKNNGNGKSKPGAAKEESKPAEKQESKSTDKSEGASAAKESGPKPAASADGAGATPA